MSSACIPPAHYVFFSTHNALANGVDRDEEEQLLLVIREVGQRKDQCVKMSAYPFYDIEMIKRLIIKHFNLPRSTNISELRIFYHGSELPNHRSLTAYSNIRRKLRLYWSFRDGSRSFGVRPLDLRAPPFLATLLGEVNLGLQRGINPKLTMDGTGGTYMLCNSMGQHVALFKPRDEEAFAPNNPRCYEGQLGQKGFRSGVLSGEGTVREIAAFLLDAQHGGLAGVPQTTKVEGRHPAFCHKMCIKEFGGSVTPGETFWKEGSFQEHIDAHDTCGDYNPQVFAISDVHYIGILDITVLNLDRNDGNMLVALRTQHSSSTSENIKTPDGKPSRYRLIPIDHGLILPDTMDVGDVDLVWYHWPQSKIPFSTSELRHIFSLDGDGDALRLGHKLEIREDCLRTMRVTTRVLQLGAKMHLSLYQIASLLVRLDDFQDPSIMERAVRTALAQAYTAVTATALVNQGRLGGGHESSMITDLHLAESRLRLSTGGVKPVRTVTFSKSDDAGNCADLEHKKKHLKTMVVSTPPKFQNTSEITESLPPLLPNNDVNLFALSDAKSSSSDIEEGEDDDENHSKPHSGGPVTKHHFLYAGKETSNERDHKRSNCLELGNDDTVQDNASKKKMSNFIATNELVETVVLPRSNAATRRRPTTHLRRGTCSRTPAPTNCSWTLIDSHKRPVNLDWGDPLFERTFFGCFELIIKHHILEAHPDWKNYSFSGYEMLLKEGGKHHFQRKDFIRHTIMTSEDGSLFSGGKKLSMSNVASRNR